MARSDEPVPTLLSLFRRSTRAMVDELVRRLAAAGYPDITPSEHVVFESLRPGGDRLTALAARIGMTHQAAGDIVASLERRGFLRRRPDPADGRARLVVLTGEGRRLVRVAMAEIAEIEREWARRLPGPDDPDALRDALGAALHDAANPSRR